RAKTWRNVTLRGIPAAAMPPSQLPDATLDALVALIMSLNAPAADSAVPGDRAAGKEFFFGKGQCASCHIVYGAGEAIGPDLSNVARELTVDEIRRALLPPPARLTSPSRLVAPRLRAVRALRGFVRNRTRFDIQLQDLKGVFHSVSLERVSAIEEQKQPLMPPVKATPGELQNLIAYLAGLTGVHSGAPTSSRTAGAGGVDFP